MARILICDDSAFMRTMLRRILANNGHEVVGEAGNGAEALEQFKKLRPDITTMDITMPEVDGLEGVRRIHEEDCLARIIMVTAIGQKGVVKTALRDGASDFIVKPFEAEEGLRIVDKILERDKK